MITFNNGRDHQNTLSYIMIRVLDKTLSNDNFDYA